VTTIEKSGYGLNTETEMRQLSAARAVGRSRPVTIRTTFLGAHALPPEADGDKDRYIDLVCREMLPAVEHSGLADAVDAFNCNPGSSPLRSLLLAMNMGATLFRMAVAECLACVTQKGARALAVLVETGTLEAGKWCNLSIWNIDRPAELIYQMGFNPLHSRVWMGR
jgi:imidazolonepropionase-like amidohydrolase